MEQYTVALPSAPPQYDKWPFKPHIFTPSITDQILIKPQAKELCLMGMQNE
jgi:hypothetical protein